MTVYLNELHSLPRSNPRLRWKVLKMVHYFLTKENLQNVELGIILSHDEHLHQLNTDYRKLDKPTDVLSFPLEEAVNVQNKSAKGEKLTLGEVYISVDRALEQAKEDNLSWGYRVLYLLGHGLYHLIGFDHQNEGEEREMDQKVRGLIAMIKQEAGNGFSPS